MEITSQVCFGLLSISFYAHAAAVAAIAALKSV